MAKLGGDETRTRKMLLDAARRWRSWKVTKRNLVVGITRHHRTCLLKNYTRPPCAPSFVKSRMFRPLQTHFVLFQQISFVLVCIHLGMLGCFVLYAATSQFPTDGRLIEVQLYFLYRSVLERLPANSQMNCMLFIKHIMASFPLVPHLSLSDILWVAYRKLPKVTTPSKNCGL